VRPALKAGLLPVWRSRDTLQLGVDARRAIAVTGMAAAAGMIGLLDGSRDRAQVVAEAAERGIAASTAERVLDVLAAAGALDDFPAETLRAVPADRRRRLTGELAAVSLARRDCDGGASALARRQAATIEIRGQGPAGPAIARLLAAAGAGRLDGPAGAAVAGAGRRRAGTPPSLIVLTERQPPEAVSALLASRVPHLAMSTAEAIGVVGPLVLPGGSACLRCLDFTRAEHDPAWPLILAQLVRRPPAVPAGGAVLIAAVAAQAAAQVLDFLDRPAEAPAAVNGTLELVPPGWRWRRRTWPAHPLCTCGGHRHPGQAP
jgi:hypothetical protein